MQARLAKREWWPGLGVGKLDPEAKSQFATMAILEMLTGYPAEYIYKKGSQAELLSHGGSNAGQYEQGVDDTTTGKETFMRWILGSERDAQTNQPLYNLPIANWNPTVMKSNETGIRAVKPWPGQPIWPNGGVALQDTRAPGPDFDVRHGDSEAYDRKRSYDELFDYVDQVEERKRLSMSWIARLKLDYNNKSPLDLAMGRAGEQNKNIRETEYFT